MDLRRLKTHSLKKRKSKVDRSLLAKPPKTRASFAGFLDSLPNVLKAKDLKEIVRRIITARKKGKPVIALLGAHVVKCGLSPIVIDLVQKNIVTVVALNGAGIIHDFEMAFCGQTSEDVDRALQDGSFGMARETPEFIHAALREGIVDGKGFGESVAAKMAQSRLPYRDLSIACACFKKRIPFTVHVAIGTDIIHQHASCDGATTGEATLKDFRILTEEVAKLNDGGVCLNIGSAVILPEVFLKALSVARNLTGRVKNFTTVNMDMSVHYRPHQNIVRRPVADGGRGYCMVGHHEIMLPLLAHAIAAEMQR
ncbi:MAG: hypothetical protein V1863_04230 [Candidatus Omnitrophota bacterium]